VRATEERRGASLTDISAPSNEDGTTARLLRWCRAAGERIDKDEPLLELETDKVTVEVPSPASGELAEILVGPDTEVTPGQLLGRVRTEARLPAGGAGAGGEAGRGADVGRGGGDARRDGAAGAGAGGGVDASEAGGPEAASGGARGPVGGGAPSERTRGGAGGGEAGPAPLSPAVRARLQAHGLEAREIAGSGAHGRITVADVERHLAKRAAVGSRIVHTPIRRRVAEHMARSLAEAPHVTTLFEADLTRIQAHRREHLARFEAAGVRLTLTAYFALAAARTLTAHPALNATYREDALELHPDVNLGIGTALGEGGLIVPVIARAQTLDLETTARCLQTLTAAARAGTLRPEDVHGGTFTLSNHGVSGSLLAAPIIIPQPQVAILGIGKVQRRVCVLEVDGTEMLAVRPMCYLTLSLDHRALDAFQANAFMRDLVERLEQWV